MPPHQPPRQRVVSLDGSNVGRPVLIPEGTSRVVFQARGTTTVQVGLNGEQSANTVGEYFSLVSGQPFEFEAPTEEGFAQFFLTFYAAATETVDVVYW